MPAAFARRCIIRYTSCCHIAVAPRGLRSYGSAVRNSRPSASSLMPAAVMYSSRNFSRVWWHEHLVLLAALLVEAHPAAPSLREVVLDLHADDRVHAGEGVDRHADKRGCASLGDGELLDFRAVRLPDPGDDTVQQRAPPRRPSTSVLPLSPARPSTSTGSRLLLKRAAYLVCELARLPSWTSSMVLDANGRLADRIELRDPAAQKRSGRTIPRHPDLRREYSCGGGGAAMESPSLPD